MINKNFDLIEKSDILSLVSDGVAESKTLEYKESLPGNSDNDKKEFLADVSSFGNASGGDIIYGIKEKRDSDGKTTGIPEVANGLGGINTDAEIRRLDNILRDGLTPRINGVRIRAIDGFTDGLAIFVRVPKSWSSPHMIAKGDSRFYSRNSAGKYPLDVSEIRTAFTLSVALGDRIRQFRDSRLAKIIADETPVLLHQRPKTVLHLLPLVSLDLTTQLDLFILRQKMSDLRTMHTISLDSRYNFDGILTTSRSQAGEPYNAYLQLFRNGAIEAVDAETFWEQRGQKTFQITEFESYLIDALEQYLKLEKNMGIEPPIVVMLSLLGINEFVISSNSRLRVFPKPVDRDNLLIPDILVEDYDVPSMKILRPAFDTVWQAWGMAGSMNYNSDGQYIGR